MSVLAAWILIGVPALALGLAMFVGRSPGRALVGYVVLGCGSAALTAVHRVSGALLGAVLALLYAAGRGGAMEHAEARADELRVLDVEEGGDRGDTGAR